MTIKAGTATIDKENGADYNLKYHGQLPKAFGRTWNEADINYTGGYRT